MKTNIDDILNRLARRTHSPRGQQSASGQIYKQLLDRIPAEQRPIIGQSGRTQRSKYAAEQMPLGRSWGAQHTFFPRWSAAACLLLVVGIGLAIAGVWYHQYYAIPSTGNGQSISGQSDISDEPRTLIYQNAPLADIVAELSEIYHTSIQITDSELGDYCVTATFSSDEPLEEILSILAEIADFEVHETAEGILLR